jgi:hypothetical protein
VPGLPNVYAVGKGAGLYEINPDAVQERPQPIAAFNAVGHLVIGRPGGPAFASAAAPNTPNNRYDRVLRLALNGQITATYTLHSPAGAPVQGEDDIAVLHTPGSNNAKLYAVANGQTANDPKSIVVFNANLDAPAGAPGAIVNVENTRISLGLAPGFLVIAFEDSYRLGLMNETTNQLVTLSGSQALFRHPVQIAPRSIAAHFNTERLYSLNFTSNTISVVPMRYLRPENQLNLQALAQYRDDVLEAFADLLGGFLQYLKDCFCDHLLVDCPTCDDEDRIYLACASIRDHQVYQVCNFSKRKYVKTFPTVEYWLSVIPIIPLVREVVRKFCCSILPDLFAKFSAPQGQVTNNLAAQPNRLKGVQMQQAVDTTRTVRSASLWRDLGSRFNVAKMLGADLFTSAGAQSTAGVSPAPRTTEVVGQRADTAVKNLESAGVLVAGVQPYDRTKGATNLMAFLRSGGQIPKDRPVTLFEEDGVVKYYSVAAAPVTADTTALNEALVATRADVAATRAEVERTRADLDSARTRLETIGTAAQEVATLRQELEETKRTSAEALAARDREITTLRTKMERDLTDLRTLRTEFDTFRRNLPG